MSAPFSAATKVALVATALLPWPIKRFVYRHFFGWSIEPGARVGVSVIMAQRVCLGRDSRIGHCNMIRNLPELVLGDGCAIGQFNWITCGTFFTDGSALAAPPDRQGLFMSTNAALTSRHYIDTPGGVYLDEFALIAGVRSSVLTHSVDFASSRMVCAPIRIGTYTYVGSDTKIAPGAVIGARCVIGMGSVVVGDLSEPSMLYAGSPARKIRSAGEGDFFWRLHRRGL